MTATEFLIQEFQKIDPEFTREDIQEAFKDTSLCPFYHAIIKAMEIYKDQEIKTYKETHEKRR